VRTFLGRPDQFASSLSWPSRDQIRKEFSHRCAFAGTTRSITRPSTRSCPDASRNSCPVSSQANSERVAPPDALPRLTRKKPTQQFGAVRQNEAKSSFFYKYVAEDAILAPGQLREECSPMIAPGVRLVCRAAQEGVARVTDRLGPQNALARSDLRGRSAGRAPRSGDAPGLFPARPGAGHKFPKQTQAKLPRYAAAQ
jgi:hypothetical protein